MLAIEQPGRQPQLGGDIDVHRELFDGKGPRDPQRQFHPGKQQHADDERPERGEMAAGNDLVINQAGKQRQQQPAAVDDQPRGDELPVMAGKEPIARRQP